MSRELALLEDIYLLLRNAGLVSSKGDFSKRMLGKSRSYLTSMRARQRRVSSDIILGLGEVVISEIRARKDDRDVADRIVLRRAMVQINGYLADQTIPSSLKKPLALETNESTQECRKVRVGWFQALIGAVAR